LFLTTKPDEKQIIIDKMSINTAFKLVIELSRQFNIDESHALKHSMEVYGYARKIVASELLANPQLASQTTVIYLAAILHDMCDMAWPFCAKGLLRSPA
jgi:HD superfamily phosphodiesterase